MSDSQNSGIQVIARAASILREVATHPKGLSLGQLAAATGLARSTVQRIVYALENEHLVQAGLGGVRPGWGLRQLGNQAGPDVLQYIRPHLFRLFEVTQETVDVSTLWDGEVLFLERFLSDMPPHTLQSAGKRFPAYTMANGKALLAALNESEVKALYGTGMLERFTPGTLNSVNELLDQLRQIRDGAFAYDAEEHAIGACAIGLPLRGDQATALAISVVIPSDRFSSRRKIVEKALKECVQACEEHIKK